MRSLRLAVLTGAALALGVGAADAAGPAIGDGSADGFAIELPPLADAILNGNTSDLDPVLLEALSGDFTFALGISIGSAFATDNLALAEALTSATVINRGEGSGEVEAVVDVFASPELASVTAWVQAHASPRPVSAD